MPPSIQPMLKGHLGTASRYKLACPAQYTLSGRGPLGKQPSETDPEQKENPDKAGTRRSTAEAGRPRKKATPTPTSLNELGDAAGDGTRGRAEIAAEGLVMGSMVAEKRERAKLGIQRLTGSVGKRLVALRASGGHPRPLAASVALGIRAQRIDKARAVIVGVDEGGPHRYRWRCGRCSDVSPSPAYRQRSPGSSSRYTIMRVVEYPHHLHIGRVWQRLK